MTSETTPTTTTTTTPTTASSTALTVAPNDTLLLTLSLPPTQEELVTDWLYEQGVIGFSSWHGWGHTGEHGETPSRLSLKEQIQGKENRSFIALHLSGDRIEHLLTQLAQHQPNLNLHYWIQPVIQAGSLASFGRC